MLRYLPDFETARRIAAEYSSSSHSGGTEFLLPVVQALPADLETPLSAYLKLTNGRSSSGYSFLLESVVSGTGPARYSFIGAEPYQVVEIAKGDNPFDALRRLVQTRKLVDVPGLSLPPFSGGAVGFVGYESVGQFEPVPAAPNDTYNLPLALFGLYDTVVTYDHAHSQMLVIALISLSDDIETAYYRALERIEAVVARLAGPLPDVGGGHVALATPEAMRSNCTREQYERNVELAGEHIRAGDIIQVVLSQRFERPTAADPLSVYRALRSVNPSPYMFYLQLGEFQLIGTSPEMLVQVRDGRVAMHPIAGTRRRGATRREDEALAVELLADEKERAEHLMLVDLGRNDVGRVAEIGSVAVPDLFAIEYYSHVMHLVSHVTGRLRSDKTAVDALQSSFPAGTLSGAPKVRAMQIIAELENDQRGPYGGAAGYVGFDGNMDTAIVIRTVFMRDGVATVQVGAGIVADSVPAAEFEETLNKAGAMFTAITVAEQGQTLPAGVR